MLCCWYINWMKDYQRHYMQFPAVLDRNIGPSIRPRTRRPSRYVNLGILHRNPRWTYLTHSSGVFQQNTATSTATRHDMHIQVSWTGKLTSIPLLKFRPEARRQQPLQYLEYLEGYPQQDPSDLFLEPFVISASIFATHRLHAEQLTNPGVPLIPPLS
jgi:hypothetical protein